MPAADPVSRELLTDAVASAIGEPERLLSTVLDARAGGWQLKSACALAIIARRCVEREKHRCIAVDIVHEVDAIAGR